MIIPIKDHFAENILQYLDSAKKFIDAGRATGNVLVHCACGVSRSSAIVISYIMCSMHMTFSKAFTFLISHHKNASPNGGFQKQLQEYEKQLKM